MCGIVGILGGHEVAPIILDALRRLEYRGYDSAGIATLHAGRMERRRATGKLAALSDLLVTDPLRGRAGIVVCAVGSALIFGLCHQYGPVLVFPVVLLGVNFALLRESRGSLIAPVTAHALHNGTVAIMAYSVIRLIS